MKRRWLMALQGRGDVRLWLGAPTSVRVSKYELSRRSNMTALSTHHATSSLQGYATASGGCAGVNGSDIGDDDRVQRR
jgi:hypothetical protein